MTPTPSPTDTPATDAMAALSSDADWWMVALTAVGIAATLWIAWLTYRANKEAGRAQTLAVEAYTKAVEALESTSSAQTEALVAAVERSNSRNATVELDAPAGLPSPDVRWNLERDGKNKWLLRNVGKDTARSAIVHPASASDDRDLVRLVKEPIDISPGGTLPFAVFRSFASPPATIIEVAWLDGSRFGTSARFVVS